MATTIQELSIAAIVIDPELQPRVKTDMEHVAKLQAVIEEGVSITEPDVFFDEATGIYLMADGFHRHAAHVKLGRPSIRCRVHRGTRRDAMVFATRANMVHTGLMLSAKDKRKAVKMLLADAKWSLETSRRIADHTGCSVSHVAKIRLEYRDETGTPIPSEITDSAGRTRSYGRAIDRLPKPTIRKRDGTRHFKKKIDGKAYSLGRTEREAREKLTTILESRQSRRRALDLGSVLPRLVWDQISVERASFQKLYPSHGLNTASISGLLGDGWVVTSTAFEHPGDFALALGAVLWLRAACNVPRAVILCYREDAPAELFPAAESLGVEFLTPDEFVASVKPE